MTYAQKCYKIAYAAVRMYHNVTDTHRAYTPKTHAVILSVGENAEITCDERRMITAMPDAIWQAAKAASINSTLSDQVSLLMPRKKRKLIRHARKNYEEVK